MAVATMTGSNPAVAGTIPIDALFSPRLWTADGLATEAGDKTFWDRSTLYGLRGVFAAGATEKALEYLTYYSKRRLLGDHVPYPVEAYPEGNQRHLSAESALYCRVYTEGMFGLRPTGFDSFLLTPRLPAGFRDFTEYLLSRDFANFRDAAGKWLTGSEPFVAKLDELADTVKSVLIYRGKLQAD